MAGMGPPPKPADQRRRRNATPNTTKLPAEGREGDAPEWPLPAHSEAEAVVWAEVWTTPQAVAWEQLGWTRTVARYVRVLVEAELPDAAAAKLGEVRQLEDRLGLSPMAMLRLRWEIVADEVAERRAEVAPTSSGARARLRVVDPDVVTAAGD